MATSIFLIASLCNAQPILTVVDNGLNGSSNREWLVQVAPDASLFTGGQGSIAAELAFEVTTGTLVSASKNATLWPHDNPGHDPFASIVSTGLNTDTVANTVFAALGSDLFTSGAPVNILTIETAGSGATTLSWGGHTLLTGQANEYTGSRLAQAGTNYDAYMGLVTVSVGLACDLDADSDCDLDDIGLLYATSPDTAAISTWLADASDPTNPYKTTYAGGTVNDVYKLGDVNLNGDIDSTDLGLLLNNFSSGAGVGWAGGDLDADSNVGSTDLGLLLNNFSFMSPAAAAAAVPEPASQSLLFLALAGMFCVIRRK